MCAVSKPKKSKKKGANKAKPEQQDSATPASNGSAASSPEKQPEKTVSADASGILKRAVAHGMGNVGCRGTGGSQPQASDQCTGTGTGSCACCWEEGAPTCAADQYEAASALTLELYSPHPSLWLSQETPRPPLRCELLLTDPSMDACLI